MDSLKLESLKNKGEHAQSAIASQEVREHLAGFIRSKRGSSSQINTISGGNASSSGTSKRGQQLTPLADNGGEHMGEQHFACGSHQAKNQDDHPLRKTASMPTMHIPLKAQSLSRRRQMERRTTMSPLMKRKSRPRRPPLHSLEASEYSSNPCIMAGSSGLNPRSLSQSNSPPAPMQHQQQPPLLPPSSSSLHHQLSDPNGLEYFRSQAGLKHHLSSGGGGGGGHLHDLDSLQSSSTSNTTSLDSSGGGGPSGCEGELQESLRQRHMRVQEAIRKTIISRSQSGRNKMVATAGGSLDSEMSASRFDPTSLLLAAQNSSELLGAELTGSTRFGQSEAAGQVRSRDELRQWSLDGADLRASLSAQRAAAIAAANRTLAYGLLHRLKLSTTSDAASLRRSQSPVSSISMGGGPTQTVVSSASASQQAGAASQQIDSGGVPPTLGQFRPTQAAAKLDTSHQALRKKQFSSSSSSTSSLFSGQDSLEDSSSQAIDLSSSSEASRNRKQQQQLLQQAAMDSASQQLVGSYQVVLQESFNQLQLCHEMKPSPLLGTHSLVVGQLEQQQQQQQQLDQVNTQSNPVASLSEAELLASLSQQFNLTPSVQNLIASQELQLQQSLQQPQLNPLLVQHQQQELNNWLLAYGSLADSSECQQAGEISSSLLAKIASLPEPYRSTVLAQLIQQQHLQQQQQQLQLLDATQQSRAMLLNHLHQQQQQQSALLLGANQDQKSMIARASSSPMLIASRVAAPGESATMNGETPMQSIEFEPSVRQLEVQMDCNNTPANHTATSLDLSLSGGLRDPSDRMTGAGASRQNRSGDTCERGAGKMSSGSSLVNSDKKQLDCNLLFYNPIFKPSSSTGLVYELELCNHKCICQDEHNHPENSFRVLAIWRRLHDCGLMARCARIEGRRASLSELQLCHGETYANYFGRTPYERIKLRQLDLSKLPIEGLTQLECGGQGADVDTAWNEEQTPGVARLAAGCVIEAAVRVATGKLLNAFAVVRPPGHHAEHQQAMGFCFFNSVAIAARVLVERHKADRILIVDWDVHHGNGIQKAFYESDQVMYISLHRHDKGNFFPGTGNLKELGAARGRGFNWNIAWSGDIMGDAEYLAAFRALIMPVARDFQPQLVLVACGFDGAAGHSFNFGGYELSPACFAYMTGQLMQLAAGRLVLCLEGGYQLEVICDCAQACLQSLLRDTRKPAAIQHETTGGTNPDRKFGLDLKAIGADLHMISQRELEREPNLGAREVLLELSHLAEEFWPGVAQWRHSICASALEATSKLT